MCFKEILGRAKRFWEQDRRACIAIAAIAAAGILLRALMINATDISGDEVFFTTYAYKIASLLGTAPVIAVGIAAITVIALYLVACRRSLLAVWVIAALALVAKFGFGMPYLTKAPAPLFVVVTGFVIYFTRLLPNIAGELVSTASMVGLAFVGLYFGSKWNRNVGFFAFALLMLSPYSIFMSSTSFINPLAWFLAFAGLAVFFEGMKDGRLLPLAGLLTAAAFAARFSTLIILPVFIAVAFLNRERLFNRQNRKNAAIFFTLVLAISLFFTPLILNQFESARGWEERGGTQRWDLNEAQMSAFVQEAADSGYLGQDFFMFGAMALFYSPLFVALLAFGLCFGLLRVWQERDLRLASMLFVGVAVFAFFFLAMSFKRMNRGLGYEFPFVMLVSFALFSGKSFFRARQAVGLLLIAVFLVLGMQVVSVHGFNGISEFVESVPEESVVYTSEAFFTVGYYKGIYLYDLSIRKPFFDRIFRPDPEIEAAFQEKRRTVVASLEELETADYALVREHDLGQPGYEALEGFERCEPIKNGSYTMFAVFARDKCP